jgi:uncharacterized protein (TIGR01777 family)
MTPSEPAPNHNPSLRVAITGASGFLGCAIAARLQRDGITIQRVRRASQVAEPDIAWTPAKDVVDVAALDGVDAVVNLAGEPIAQRWTSERKRKIRESRVAATSLLCQAIARLRRKPRVFLSGSAIGIYGDREQEELDETSAPGADFLAETALAWERATDPAREAGVRVVLLRTGIVLGRGGGALAKMLLPFKLGLGGRVGPGTQWMSWIGLHDWVAATRFLLATDAIGGPVNLVAPNPVPNAEFAATLARVLGRPALAHVPARAIDLLFGEMGRATLLASQRVHPRQLMEAGFEFDHPTLEQSLRAELDRLP